MISQDPTPNKTKSKRNKAKRSAETVTPSSNTRWLSFALLLTGAIICGVAFFGLRLPWPSVVRGTLVQFGDVSLQYDTPQSSGISPLCGCFAEVDAQKWRGITFFGSQIRLYRTGGPPMTEYLISSAFPGEIVWDPSIYAERFNLECTIWMISIPLEVVFDANALLKQTLPAGYEVERRVECDGERYLALVSADPVNVTLLGETPLSAWIPAKNSLVSIRTERRMSLNSVAAIHLTENYRPWDRRLLQARQDDLAAHRVADFPLADFLGPNVIIWSADPRALVTAAKGVRFKAISQPQRQTITAIVIPKPPWSARISCIPVSMEWKDQYLRVLPDLHELPMAQQLREPGAIEFTVTHSANSETTFEATYQFMKDHELIWRNDIYRSASTPEGESSDHFNMEFRYPPVPPKEGFNIFGKINYFSLSSALGKLILGSRQPVILDVGSELRFERMRGLQVNGGVISVPIKASGTNAEFQIESVSRVAVNGDTVNSLHEKLGLTAMYQQLALLAAIIQAACAVITLKKIL